MVFSKLFSSLLHAQELTQQWMQYYSEERPHQALAFKTPINYAA
jgi:transposase InsO family protein